MVTRAAERMPLRIRKLNRRSWWWRNFLRGLGLSRTEALLLAVAFLLLAALLLLTALP